MNSKNITTGVSMAIATLSAGLAPTTMAQPILEEVIVTAQKRAQSLQDVPITVNAVGEEALQNAGVSEIVDIDKLVPSLTVLTTGLPSRTSIRIRGIGTNPSDPSLEPSVGLFIDGVFMPRSVFGLSDLVDVERIEVLNGPQGTLYGKNTNAGVISVTTQGMPSESLEGFGEVTAGNESQLDGKISIASALSDTLGVRFGGNVRSRDGVYDDINSGDDYDEIDKQSYRGQVFWLPTDAWSVRAAGYYSKTEGKVGANDWQFDSDYVAGTAFLTGQDITNQVDDDPQNHKMSRDYIEDSELEVKGGSVQVDYTLESGLTITSITAVQNWELSDWGNDVDQTSLDILSTRVYQDEDSFSQELRLTSPGGETVDWLFGAYYFDSDLQVGDINKPFAIWGQDLVPLLALAGHTFNHQADYTTESFSAFGQATWNFTENTSVTAGLRYANEEKDFETRVDAFDNTGTSVSQGGAIDTFGLNVTFSGLAANGLQPIHLEDDLTDNDVSGMLSLNHFIGDTMLYATVATGTKSGGFNGNFGPAPLEAREYDPESSINYEVGAKIDGLLDGRARVNVAVFYTTFEDFQTTIYDASIPGFVTSNADEQTTAGVNLDASFLVTDNLMLDVSLEYLDAEFDDFEGAACHPSGPKATQVSPTAFVCDFSGETPYFVADWSGVVSANYILPLSNGAEAYAYAGYNFRTKHDTATDGYDQGEDDLENLDARLGWRNDNWDIAVWGQNLTDDVYNLGYSENTFTASIYPALGLTQRQTYDRWLSVPRSYGMSLRYMF